MSECINSWHGRDKLTYPRAAERIKSTHTTSSPRIGSKIQHDTAWHSARWQCLFPLRSHPSWLVALLEQDSVPFSRHVLPFQPPVFSAIDEQANRESGCGEVDASPPLMRNRKRKTRKERKRPLELSVPFRGKTVRVRCQLCCDCSIPGYSQWNLSTVRYPAVLRCSTVCICAPELLSVVKLSGYHSVNMAILDMPRLPLEKLSRRDCA